MRVCHHGVRTRPAMQDIAPNIMPTGMRVALLQF